MLSHLIVVSVLICGVNSLVGFTQSAGARGVLLCHGQPISGVKVKLYDHDRTDMDDLMDSGYTNDRGEFTLMGSEDEFTTIDPKINIYHDCDDGWWPCQRKISITIPDSYITKGARPNRIYDAGRLELSGKYKGESRDCIHRK
ncbi:unnamed protein product [Bursaphelenchus xylophilus]|uniref:(pine wood nematode) hypothetical protein n=1 Tax=Bursaphelenchus xylophilus TaxID=6326 RepID=A0A1I7RSM1_BURXY|nr:unnamed protein product [Bursaphelenchus xylophilus]CAG9122872.1 unnamed protein product [Bursaphelenchus xylophilus]